MVCIISGANQLKAGDEPIANVKNRSCRNNKITSINMPPGLPNMVRIRKPAIKEITIRETPRYQFPQKTS